MATSIPSPSPPITNIKNASRLSKCPWEQNHLRLITAVLSNPLCSHNRRLRSEGLCGSLFSPRQISRFPSGRALAFPFPTLMPRHQPSRERQCCPRFRLGGQGRGWGWTGLGSAKGISESLELILCASRLLIQAMPQTCSPPNELC